MQNSSKKLSKQAAYSQKPQNTAARDADKKEQTEHPLTDIERKQQRGDQNAQTEYQVQQMREKSHKAAQYAQNVVIHAKAQSKQHAQHQLNRLKRNRQLHQPNNLANSPTE